MKKIHVIGGGLAGVFSAARLLAAGAEVVLWEGNLPGRASLVAAGLFNVITGRFGAKTWQAETLMQGWKDLFAQPLFAPLARHVHYTDIYRPFADTAEFNTWTGRSGDPAYSDFVSLQSQPILPEQIINPEGGILIHQCGWADVPALLDEMVELLAAQYPASFSIESREWVAMPGEMVVHTSGWRSTLLGNVPVIPNKGELLIIHAPELQTELALSRKAYVIPWGQDHYAVGGSYAAFPQGQPIGTEHFPPSDHARSELQGYLAKLLKVPYTIADHKAGVRPTTPDRKPIIGQLSDNEWIFTGLGSKGILYAPWGSQLLADAMLNGGHIPHEVAANRWKK